MSVSERKFVIGLLIVTIVSLLLLASERWQKVANCPTETRQSHKEDSSLTSSTLNNNERERHFRERYLQLVRDTLLGYSLRTREKSFTPSLDEGKTVSQFYSGCVSSLLGCNRQVESSSTQSKTKKIKKKTKKNQSNTNSKAEEREKEEEVLVDDGREEEEDNYLEGETRQLMEGMEEALSKSELTCRAKFDQVQRMNGKDWPMIGLTMAGQVRIDSLRSAVEGVIKNNVEGDWVECGVWRGGSSIYAKALFDSLDRVNNDRLVWLVDSFVGLPPPRKSGMDTLKWSKLNYLRVPLDEVQENFRAFNLLDDKVKFCQGYFVNSLPKCGCRNRKIAILRMDGDMYESTMDQLFNLYERVVVGGYVLIDDWMLRSTSLALEHFFGYHAVKENIIPLTDGSAYFIKTQAFTVNMTHYQV
eukprot:TRINITY_DN6525_c0_g1_i1.p1 TRINITY_DN6525_c0_g1~~TRINITY_DN6525_c0_g1_i1.p1  ORF type:complete len:416 (-),score=108.94 TRINITY_DN6525_c0_g1_i1:94-1341(-)